MKHFSTHHFRSLHAINICQKQQKHHSSKQKWYYSNKWNSINLSICIPSYRGVLCELNWNTSGLTACVKAVIISCCLFPNATSFHCNHLLLGGSSQVWHEQACLLPPGFAFANTKGTNVVKFLSLHEMGATSGSNKSGQISFKQSVSEKPCDCLLITSLNINSSILFHAT